MSHVVKSTTSTVQLYNERGGKMDSVLFWLRIKSEHHVPLFSSMLQDIVDVIPGINGSELSSLYQCYL